MTPQGTQAPPPLQPMGAPRSPNFMAKLRQDQNISKFNTQKEAKGPTRTPNKPILIKEPYQNNNPCRFVCGLFISGGSQHLKQGLQETTVV